MSVEFIGYISHTDQSEIRPPQGDALDQEHLVRTAKAHEAGGFDRVLVAHHSSNPDGILLAAHAAAQTNTLKFMIAHRPGFIAPTYAARLFATFDQLTGGRAGIHIITAEMMPNSVKTGIFSTMRSVINAPMSGWKLSAAPGPVRPHSTLRETFSTRTSILQNQTRPAPASAYIFWGCLRYRDRGRRPTCRHLRPLG